MQKQNARSDDATFDIDAEHTALAINDNELESVSGGCREPRKPDGRYRHPIERTFPLHNPYFL